MDWVNGLLRAGSGRRPGRRGTGPWRAIGTGWSWSAGVRRLERCPRTADADVDVTLVDRTNHHLFQPLLYQVAAGILAPGLIAPALRRTVKKQANARTLLAEMYDLECKVVVARERTVGCWSWHGWRGRALLDRETWMAVRSATPPEHGGDSKPFLVSVR